MMRKKPTAVELDNPPPVSRADIAAGKLVPRQRGPGGKLLPGKQRVNIFLDRAVIEHFRAKAGERGYQTLINESLREIVRGETLTKLIRQTIREELQQALRPR